LAPEGFKNGGIWPNQRTAEEKILDHYFAALFTAWQENDTPAPAGYIRYAILDTVPVGAIYAEEEDIGEIEEDPELDEEAIVHSAVEGDSKDRKKSKSKEGEKEA